MGRVTATELQRLYREAWVFCLPSTYEGFGIPYIEAMASGTPVVATPNAGALEVTESGQYGIIVEDSELGISLAALLSSESRRNSLAASSLNHVQRYDLSQVAAQYEALYRSVVPL